MKDITRGVEDQIDLTVDNEFSLEEKNRILFDYFVSQLAIFDDIDNEYLILLDDMVDAGQVLHEAVILASRIG